MPGLCGNPREICGANSGADAGDWGLFDTLFVSQKSGLLNVSMRAVDCPHRSFIVIAAVTRFGTGYGRDLLSVIP